MFGADDLHGDGAVGGAHESLISVKAVETAPPNHSRAKLVQSRGGNTLSRYSHEVGTAEDLNEDSAAVEALRGGHELLH